MKKQLLITVMTLLCIRASAQPPPSYVDTTGLSGWWSFTGNANDSSLHGNNGTVNGATLTTDRFGNANRAYSFDGVTDYIEVLDNPALNLTNNFTISLWVKLVDYTASVGMVSKPSTPTTTGYVLRALDGSATGHSAADNYTFAVEGPHVLFSNDTLPLAWTHIVITYTDSVESLYRNDTLVAQDTITYSLAATTQSLLFGKEFNTGTSDRWFKGSLDDIGIWTRVLSDCEISKLFYATNTLIVNQPVNDTVLTGATATYSITDTGGIATYQWQENRGSGFTNLSNIAPYSGVTTQTLTISLVTVAMNNYQYRCVRIGTACEDTSSNGKLIVNTSTGITIMNIQKKITIAPNPFQNNVSISSPALITEVVVSNMIGQVVFSKDYNDNKINIALNDLPQGVYILRINGSETYKIVKQ